jgi:ComF family protein
MMTTLNWLSALPRGLLDAVLPSTCPVTGQWIAAEQDSLHPAVAKHLQEQIQIPYCSHCGRSTPPATAFDHRCGGCRHEAHWNLRAIVRLGIYSPIMRALLLDLKFRGHPRTASILGVRLAQQIAAQPWCGEISRLVPVPMYRLRRWQRPHNHAAELAKVTGRQLGIPVSRAVRQQRMIPSQVSILTRESKIKNVRGAFTFRGKQPFAEQTVCLIDNLITSGATLIELARTVRRGGARKVYAAVAARAGSPGDRRDPLWIPDSISSQ